MFRLATARNLLLASKSPRRSQLLASLGLSFSICPVNVREPAPEDNEIAEGYVRKLARLKGLAAMRDNPSPDILILAADTIVCVEGKILGKPRDQADAFAMLQMLNGREHLVLTAIFLAHAASNFRECGCAATRVRFGLWPDAALAAYAACGEPLDKAGAYAIQGRGAFMIEHIEGSWTNVVGLPLSLLVHILLKHGFIAPRAFCQ